MIYIGLGGNLPWKGEAVDKTIRAALLSLQEAGAGVKKTSPFYRTAPVPVSAQPWYVNAVAEIETPLNPQDVMALLLHTEQKFGRMRSEKNDARTLDLDLIDYRGLCLREGNVELPHPRLATRAFVLYPLRDIAPTWRHPVSGKNIDQLIAALPPQALEKLSS
jgi:2-amino-4-hydroxy-6-hydroxymethyldihydropteridine diphosphokinase